MAKLQGHLLKHRESARSCIDHATDLTKEDTNLIQKSMTVEEWLHRLNLLHLKPAFIKHKLHRVEDLIYMEAEQMLAENALTGDPHNKLHSRRMWNMLVGETETKENFKYLSKHGVRSVGALFLGEGKGLEELVSAVPEDTLTGF